MFRTELYALCVILASITSMANAYDAGDVIVRFGATTVAPNDDSDTVLGISEARVGSDTTFGLTSTYMITDEVGIELLVSAPFKHDIDLAGLGNAGDTKHLPPTLTLQYYPLDSFSSNETFQPYIGIGLNYTKFFEEDTNASTVGDSELNLKDSLGVAFNAGVDIALGESWAIAFEAWYIDIDTEAKVSGDVNTRFDVEIDPVVFTIGAAYKF